MKIESNVIFESCIRILWLIWENVVAAISQSSQQYNKCAAQYGYKLLTALLLYQQHPYPQNENRRFETMSKNLRIFRRLALFQKITDRLQKK